MTKQDNRNIIRRRVRRALKGNPEFAGKRGIRRLHRHCYGMGIGQNDIRIKGETT